MLLNHATRVQHGEGAARRDFEELLEGRLPSITQRQRMMSRALLCVTVFLLTLIYFGESRITAEICRVKPAERHCVIESMSLSRWPHTNRYTFDWRTQRCYIMHWSTYCPLPEHDSNNFETEMACIDSCAGWA